MAAPYPVVETNIPPPAAPPVMPAPMPVQGMRLPSDVRTYGPNNARNAAPGPVSAAVTQPVHPSVSTRIPQQAGPVSTMGTDPMGASTSTGMPGGLPSRPMTPGPAAAPPVVQPMSMDPMGGMTSTGMPGGPISSAAAAGSPSRTSAKSAVVTGMLEDAFADVGAGKYASAAGQVVRGGLALPVAAGADMLNAAGTALAPIGRGLMDFGSAVMGTGQGGPISTATARPAPAAMAPPIAAAAAGGTQNAMDVRLQQQGAAMPPQTAGQPAVVPPAGAAIPGLDPSIRKVVGPDGRVTYTNVNADGARIVPVDGTMAPTGPVAGPVTSLYTDQALQAARASALARGDIAAVQASYAPAGAMQPQTTPTIIGGDPRESAFNKSFDADVANSRAMTAMNLNPGRRGAAMAGEITRALETKQKPASDMALEKTRQAGETSRTATREAAATSRTSMQEAGQDRRNANTTGTQLAMENIRAAGDRPLKSAQAGEARARTGALMATLQAQQEHAAAVESGDQAAILKAAEKLRGAMGKFEKEAPEVFKAVQVGGGVDERGMPRGQGAIIFDGRTGATRAQFDSSGRPTKAPNAIATDARAIAIKNNTALSHDEKRKQLMALGYQ
jgi:hypothetical protein